MRKLTTLIFFTLLTGVKMFAQCAADIKVQNPNQPTCGNSNGKFSVLVTQPSGNFDVSIVSADGGITLTSSTNGNSSVTFNNLPPSKYTIVVKVTGSSTICQTFSYLLRADYDNFASTSAPASNCSANGSIVLNNGIQSTDSVSWLSSLTPTFVVASSLPAKTISNLAPGLYYVTYKSPSSNYCYHIDSVTVFNTGTACPAATFCGNATDPTNVFPNGTFGSGGNADGTNAQINGPALPAGITEYTYQPLGPYAPEDGFYSIANNTFAGSDISGNHTPFGNWYDGYDHDYAATGVKNGYQMVVNASYDPDIVIQQTVNNLCPNKKYQFSAYIRELNTISGQNPANLSFLVNGVGLYTTGNIATAGGSAWQQVGFTFQPTGNSAVISIRNNSIGGAGNDWAIDDIYVGDCIPTVALQPIISSCANPATNASAIVTDASRFYDTYQWFINKNDGNGYVAGAPVQTAAFDPSNSYTASIALPADIGTNPIPYFGWMYKIIVGTTASDLTSATCSYSTSQVLAVQNCDVVLPISMKSIKAQLNNNNGEVLWTVANQLNVNRYELEKSTDNKSFIYVTSITANDNVTSYTAEDNNLSAGVTYYRIKEVDNNGTVSYSKVVILTWNGPAGSINIFPNPVSSLLFITIPSGTKITNAIITDAIGRKVLEANTTTGSINTIEVSKFAPGFYTIKMITGKNEVVNKSFIKK